MVRRLLAAGLLGVLNIGVAHAGFTLTNSLTNDSVILSIGPSPGTDALDLSGLFQTGFVLANSDGTLSYTSNGTISVTGPDGLSFSNPLVDSGNVPVGTGFAQASHSTPSNFVIDLSAAQEALFQSAPTDVTVTFSNWSTTGPTSNVAFYNWSVQNGSLTPVPLPPAAWLLSWGIAGMCLLGRKRYVGLTAVY
jgi:hypothetical protein